MTEADVKCYEGRYTDLADKKGREHYAHEGSEEKQLRLNTCAKTLTLFEAQRYIDNNPDL
jgi:hypothetical protein